MYPSPSKEEEPKAKKASLGERLRERFEFDDSRDPNKLLGYPLNKFRELAENIDGVQPGFYFLCAETNVGKIAFLTNLCLDAIETNPEISVLYFSLDDAVIYTVYRQSAAIYVNKGWQVRHNKVRKTTENISNGVNQIYS